MQTYNCEICGKKIGARDMCGFSEGHVCLECGYTDTVKETEKMVKYLPLVFLFFVLAFWLGFKFA